MKENTTTKKPKSESTTQSISIDGSHNIANQAIGDIHQEIKDSFNIIKDSKSSNKELLSCLKELTEDVNKIITLLPQEKQTLIANNLKGIVQTASENTKDKSKLEKFVKPFLDTVKTIGDVGLPIISLVTKIIGFF